MFLLDILFEQGFKLIRGKHLDYSTMRHDGTFSTYEKDGIEVSWGLCEAGKPPTLICPRPFIHKKCRMKLKDFNGKGCYLRIGEIDPNDETTFEINERFDDAMNECLATFDHKDIYEAIVNKTNVIFDLNKKEIR